MAVGEGLRLVGGIAGTGALLGLFVWAFRRADNWLLQDAEPSEHDLAAEAMVPGYAAAVRPCNCAACRNRALQSREPCSDFDGD